MLTKHMRLILKREYQGITLHEKTNHQTGWIFTLTDSSSWKVSLNKAGGLESE